jgi:tetratricopeptide (TPR) repeat protein
MNHGTAEKRGHAPATASAPDSFALAEDRLSAQRPLRNPRLQKIASHLESDRLERAEKELDDYLARHPDDADAISLMARAKLSAGRRNEALSLLARCVELAPDFAVARFNYANLLLQLDRLSAAQDELDTLLLADRSNPLFRQMKADILIATGESGQALAIFEQLAAENPGRAVAWVNYGHTLRAMGMQEKSIGAYRRAIEVRPSFGLAWWGLANMKTVRFNETDIATMQEQLNRADITADERVALQFALGKAFEDLRAYDSSYAQYAKANATMRLRADYDPGFVTARVASNKALFSPAYLQSRNGVGCKSPDPIFILGQPRSGSTLIEQILSSHSAVEGTAELPYIPAIAQRFGTDYPKILAEVEPSALAALGEAYLADTRPHRKLSRPFFVDKKPGNWIHAGLIHLILPNAKIIDARRNPAATSLSVFKHYHRKSRPRLAELARVYRDYVELMAHFDSVLPGRIHRVIYEEMVANPEAEVRKLLDHLGLPFEESCLRFYETERTVLTPSAEQVRKPITGDAVDHWRHYEPWLGALIKGLGTVLTEYPSVPEELR